MANLKPNPFVAEIAEGLQQKGEPLAIRAGRLTPSAAFAQLMTDARRQAVAITADDPDVSERGFRLVLGLAAAADVPELISFAGFVGASYTRTVDGRAQDWTVLYVDTRLQSWLLIDTKGIVYRAEVEDKKAPSGTRDVLWVKADTAVGQGNGSLSVEGQFLTGEFTRAGNFDLPVGDGTLAAATGVFCEARSVGCCRGQSNRP